MEPIKLSAFKRVIPTIYAYTTPEIPRHNGWVKREAVRRKNSRQKPADRFPHFLKATI